MFIPSGGTTVMDDLLRPADVARRLGVSRAWLYDAAKSGRIPCVRIGGAAGPVRFIERDLDAWIEQARSAWRPGDTSAAVLRRVAEDRAA
jgi:excisionase family DNA binding protein